MSDNVVAADGRVIGERALATRRRLLDSTIARLERNGVLDLKVVDITRDIGAAPATFYQYFTDIDAALLALIEEATEDEHPLLGFLDPPWRTEADRARAAAFVDAYAIFWSDHHAVLRVRDLKAEEGDPEFRKRRTAANVLLLEVMAAMVQTGQAERRIATDLEPIATAAAMVAMLERLLAYQTELQRRGSSKRAIRQTLASVLFQTLCGTPSL